MTEHKKISDDVLDTAARWLARLSADDVTNSDRRDFESWIQENTAHRDGFESLSSIDSDLSALGAFTMADLGVASPELHLVSKDAANLVESVKSQATTDSKRLWYGLAAGIAALVVGFGAWFTNPPPPASTPAIAYKTAAGERKETMLADGTIITLNTKTELSVAFGVDRRSVYLESGEIYLRVAKDPGRPFVVFAGGEAVEAIGTSLSIYNRDGKIRVAVFEGTVAFGGTPGQGIHDIYRQDKDGVVLARRLDSGQSLHYQLGQEPKIFEDPEIERSISWLDGRLFFEDRTLEDIVREVNLYTSQQIRISDQSIAQYKGSGVFNVENVDSILKALEIAWPVRVVRQSSDVVILYAK